MIKVKSHKRKGRVVRSHVRKVKSATKTARKPRTTFSVHKPKPDTGSKVKGHFNPLTGNWVGTPNDDSTTQDITKKVMNKKEPTPAIKPKSAAPAPKKKALPPKKVKPVLTKPVKVKGAKAPRVSLRALGTAYGHMAARAVDSVEATSGKYLRTRF